MLLRRACASSNILFFVFPHCCCIHTNTGKYGAVYQIRLGERGRDTKGTAFVVYEDIYDAKRAVDHLSGFNVGGRYLVVMYYQPAKFERRANAEEKKKELEELRRQVKAKKQQLANNSNQKTE